MTWNRNLEQCLLDIHVANSVIFNDCIDKDYIRLHHASLYIDVYVPSYNVVYLSQFLSILLSLFLYIEYSWPFSVYPERTHTHTHTNWATWAYFSITLLKQGFSVNLTFEEKHFLIQHRDLKMISGARVSGRNVELRAPWQQTRDDMQVSQQWKTSMLHDYIQCIKNELMSKYH